MPYLSRIDRHVTCTQLKFPKQVDGVRVHSHLCFTRYELLFQLSVEQWVILSGHSLLGQLLHGLKSSIMDYVLIFQILGLPRLKGHAIVHA